MMDRYYHCKLANSSINQNILYQKLVRYSYSMFLKFDPDIVIASSPSHRVYDYLIEQFCIIHNKKFICYEHTNIPFLSYFKSSLEHDFPYSRDKKNYSKKILSEAPLKKSHKKYGFNEPIKYFVPSIGISQLVSINKEDREFFIGAMGNQIKDQDLGIHYIKLNEKRDKIIEHKYILLNERVRDMVISKNQKTILMFLETSGSIIILKNQKN